MNVQSVNQPSIKLAFSCHMQWEQMTPCSSDKFCHSCSKTVYNLTDKTKEQIEELLLEKGSLCGRFSAHQVQEQSKQVSQYSWRKVVAGICLALGFTSFGKSVKAQAPPKQDLPKKTQESNFVLGMVTEILPEYKHGGTAAMMKYIDKNLQNKERVEGTVVVDFVVDTTGKTTSPVILKHLTNQTDAEALRLVRLLEFTPGTQNGRKIPVRYTIPLRFNLPEEKKKK